jgi:hypothetical protein
MKSVPPDISNRAPEGTEWFGGAVDRSTMTLRVHCPPDQREAVSLLLGHESGGGKRSWWLSAPDSADANLDTQVEWILSRLSSDLAAWRRITSEYKVDLFCGLFLERTNRGVTLEPETMRKVADRGIQFGFDIYAP